MNVMTTEAIEKLKQLHRGELAATETYQQALEKIDPGPAKEQMQQIHVDHREAANAFRGHLRGIGIVPDHSSEGWGTFAKAVEGTAKLFGNKAALQALKEGEKHGLTLCERALKEVLPSECKEEINNSYMPKLREHVQTLDRLIERI